MRDSGRQEVGDLPSLEGLGKKSSLAEDDVGTWGPKRLLVGKFAARGVFREGRKETETHGSWPLGRTEPAGASERRARVTGTRRSWDAWCPQPQTSVTAVPTLGFGGGGAGPYEHFTAAGAATFGVLPLLVAKKGRGVRAEATCHQPHLSVPGHGCRSALSKPRLGSAGRQPLCRQRPFCLLDPLLLTRCCVTH